MRCLPSLTWKRTAGQGGKLYECVAKKVLGYVERELTDAQGRILLRTGCGQRRCGRKVLCVYTGGNKADPGKGRRRRFCVQYGITANGNFEGKSIPNLLGNKKIMKGSVRNNSAVTVEAIWTESEEKPSKAL